MKKLIVLLLAVTMIFVLSACGSEREQSDKDSQNAPDIQSDLNDLNENLEDLDDALSALIPDGWDENNYGAYIYGVWDADFLPECFPEPIEGVKVDQTTFKDYDHDTLSGSYAVGPLYYESKEDYRSYGLFFYANQDQLDAFTAAVEAKGLNGGLTEEGEWTYTIISATAGLWKSLYAQRSQRRTMSIRSALQRPTACLSFLNRSVEFPSLSAV